MACPTQTGRSTTQHLYISLREHRGIAGRNILIVRDQETYSTRVCSIYDGEVPSIKSQQYGHLNKIVTITSVNMPVWMEDVVASRRTSLSASQVLGRIRRCDLGGGVSLGFAFSKGPVLFSFCFLAVDQDMSSQLLL